MVSGLERLSLCLFPSRPWFYSSLHCVWCVCDWRWALPCVPGGWLPAAVLLVFLSLLTTCSWASWPHLTLVTTRSHSSGPSFLPESAPLGPFRASTALPTPPLVLGPLLPTPAGGRAGASVSPGRSPAPDLITLLICLRASGSLGLLGRGQLLGQGQKMECTVYPCPPKTECLKLFPSLSSRVSKVKQRK